jgi:hypothetical protein
MTHQAVSTELNLSEGVRGTGGRAPARQPQLPRLSAEAAKMLEGLPRDSDRFDTELEKFLLAIVATPTRAGAGVLDYFAAAERRAGRLDAAQALVELRTFVVTSCEQSEAWSAAVAKFVEAARASISRVYAAGHAAGQEELRTQAPAVVRETTFITDSKDRVIGKTEREYKPGGKS